jgi:hypothetical protein
MQALMAAAAGVLLAIAGHAAALFLGLRPLRAYGASFVVGMLAVVLLLWGSRELPASLLLAALFFGCWWFGLLNFFQSSQSSLRVNILRQVLANGGTLSHESLFAVYDNPALIRLRLYRLQQSGAVIEKNGRYFVASPSLYVLARLFRVLKILIMGRRSEFDGN